MHKLKYFLPGLIAACLLPSTAFAFCGFYVAKADADLFNEASQVVLARDENKTVITMVNDFQGDPKEFAIVVPVPTFLEEGQINVANMAVVDHLDAYSAPRLVEYHDPNPCEIRYERRTMKSGAAMPMSAAPEDSMADEAESMGVTIEASYTVGEYDILILSAKESDGLSRWLRSNDYKTPEGAERVLDSYIKQEMRFFVAKVNLKEQAKLGYTKLRPIQVAYEHPRFMLPIRLGTVNAKGKQDLIVYALSPKGRVESTNYRTVKLPSGMDIPLFVRDEFSDFYKSMFQHQVQKENERAVFLEYAWDMNWCDPCAADPLSPKELRELGAFWVAEPERVGDNTIRPRRRPMPGGAQNVYLTRLHVRYDAETFPEDLAFQTTSNRENFQGRYVLRNPARGDLSCEAGKQYLGQLEKRWDRDSKTLASLTGWSADAIDKKIDWSLFPKRGAEMTPKTPEEQLPWWKRIWK